MNYLRKIIREEIERIISESVSYDTPQADIFEKGPVSKDDIIYNYEMGRIFANNSLQADIDNLNEYTLSEYLPSSINRESWSFDFESVMGTILLIDIIRVIRGGKSFWTMTFATQERGDSQLPSIEDMVEDVEGYDNFIQAVNLRMAKTIDPSKY
jgi:hypothetical protein